MQDYAVAARPLGHGLNGGVADRQIDHHNRAAQFLGELSALVHLLHSPSSDVQVMPFDLAGDGYGAVHCFHAKEIAIAPAHEGLTVNVLVVFGEVEPTT